MTPSTVAGVMNGHLQSLYSCVGQELRSGGHIGTVQIDLAIQGSGQVQGASVHGGSGSKRSIQSASDESLFAGSISRAACKVRRLLDVTAGGNHHSLA